MAINFPSSPVDAQVYTDPDSGVQYIYNTAYGVWRSNKEAVVDLAVANNGTLRATASQLNFIEQVPVTVSIVDDTAGNRSNVTIIVDQTTPVAAFAKANTACTQSDQAGTEANNAKVIANTANLTANNSWITVAAAFTKANTACTQSDQAGVEANNAKVIANTANLTANNSWITVASAFTKANTACTQSDQAGVEANNAKVIANTANLTANNNLITVASAFTKANTACTQSDAAGTQANVAYGQANNARTTANAALPNVTGTSFVGSVIVPSGANLMIGRTDSNAGRGIRIDSPGAANVAALYVNMGPNGTYGNTVEIFGGTGYSAGVGIAGQGANYPGLYIDAFGSNELYYETGLVETRRYRGTTSAKANTTDTDILGYWNFKGWRGDNGTGSYGGGASISGRQRGDASTGTPAWLEFYTNDGTTQYATSLAPRMQISNTGNVLIARTGGADSTVGAGVKLDVAGAVNASSFLINGVAVVSSYTSNVGNNSANTFFIDHNLNSIKTVPAVREYDSGRYVYPDITHVNSNTIKLQFVSAPTTNQYFLIVLG